MKTTILRPGLTERLYLAVWSVVATLLLYVAYLNSWAIGYTREGVSDYVVIEEFSPGMFSVGTALFSISIWCLAVELLGRSVVIAAGTIRGSSPLGFYRQHFEAALVEDCRVTPIFGWGRVLEVKVKGRWIVFLANSRFKDQPYAFFAEAQTA